MPFVQHATPWGVHDAYDGLQPAVPSAPEPAAQPPENTLTLIHSVIDARTLQRVRLREGPSSRVRRDGVY